MSEPLISGIKIPTLEDKKAKELDNAKFQEEQDNATPEKTKNMKDEVGNIFGKNFDPEYKKNLSKKNEEKVYDPNNPILDPNTLDMSDTGIENINNLQYYPIIDRLFETNQISKKSREILLKADLNNVNFYSIRGIDPKEKEILKGTFFNLESSENNKQQNLTELINDSKTFEKIPGLSGFDFSMNNDEFSSEVLNKVGKNYLKFPDKNNNFNEAKDLSVAIITTKIQILKNIKNIPIDTETYKVALKNIESPNLKKQLEGIEGLYNLAYSNEGKLGKKTLENYKNKRKEKLVNEYKELNKEFDKLELKETTEKINKRKKEINERITEIGNEANEIEAGDIFSANNDEKINSNIEQISSK